MRPALRVIGQVWGGSVNLQAVNTPEKYHERILRYAYRRPKGVNLQLAHRVPRRRHR